MPLFWTPVQTVTAPPSPPPLSLLLSPLLPRGLPLACHPPLRLLLASPPPAGTWTPWRTPTSTNQIAPHLCTRHQRSSSKKTKKTVPRPLLPPCRARRYARKDGWQPTRGREREWTGLIRGLDGCDRFCQVRGGAGSWARWRPCRWRGATSWPWRRYSNLEASSRSHSSPSHLFSCFHNKLFPINIPRVVKAAYKSLQAADICPLAAPVCRHQASKCVWSVSKKGHFFFIIYCIVNGDNWNLS